MSSYRQISIAIRKKLVDTQSQIVASVGALQTCHLEETERQHYALTTFGLRSLGTESFEEFGSASTAWYRFVLGPSVNTGFVSARNPFTSDINQPSTPHENQLQIFPGPSSQRPVATVGNHQHVPPTPVSGTVSININPPLETIITYIDRLQSDLLRTSIPP